MSRAILIPILALALAAPARGEPRDAVGADARKSLELTIYAQDLAVVRETRAVMLPSGESVLRFVDVPDRLDPRTVSLRSISEPGALTVRQQSLRYDLASNITLLQRYVGREVDLVETGDKLRDRVTRAVLLSAAGPIYQIGDQLAVGHPGRVTLPPIDPPLYTTPTLEWLLTNSGAENHGVAVSYSTGGLSWTADYVLALGPDAKNAALTAWITIENQSAVRWADARLAVIAGTVHTVQMAQPMMAAQGFAMKRMDAEAMPEPQQMLDYQRYALERPITIEPSVTTQVPLLEAENVPVEKQYRVESTPSWQHQAAQGDEGEVLPVTVAFEVTNDEASHLGVPLPSGVVRVYASVEGGGGVELAGEARITHVAPGERLLVTVGEANDVVARRKQTDFRKLDTKPWQVESAFEVTLRNRRKDDVVVALRERLAGQWEVVQSSIEGKRIASDILGFEVPVPAGGETVLRYVVKIGG
jgi:hypothetical protein